MPQQARPQVRRDFGEMTLPGLHRATNATRVVCTAESFGLSAKGGGQGENQDRFLTATFGRWAHVDSTNIATNEGDVKDVLTAGQGHLMMLADGMGGHSHGTLASQVVLDSLFSHLITRSNWAAEPALNADRVLEDLRHAMEHAQRRLAWVALRKRMGTSQVGTTALVGVIAWPLLLLAHAGDSRCYLYRTGRLQCLTKDHTVGQENRDQGVAAEQAKPFDRILTSAILNSGKTPQVDLKKVALQEGDVVLLCSQGVSSALPEYVLAQTICHETTPQGICEAILANALDKSDEDATVVATRIVRAI